MTFCVLWYSIVRRPAGQYRLYWPGNVDWRANIAYIVQHLETLLIGTNMTFIEYILLGDGPIIVYIWLINSILFYWNVFFPGIEPRSHILGDQRLTHYTTETFIYNHAFQTGDHYANQLGKLSYGFNWVAYWVANVWQITPQKHCVC